MTQPCQMTVITLGVLVIAVYQIGGKMECEDRRFGLNCTKTCHCKNKTETCDKVSGHCLSGCLPGWIGIDCQQECEDGRFGSNCTKTCHCKNETETCDKVSGNCFQNKGSDLQQECEDGRFGSKCTKTCHCKDKTETCDKVSGHCLSGCLPGWMGSECQQECEDGRFGSNCTKTCHCDIETETCDKVSGHCFAHRGSDWQQECEDGRFGSNCRKTCHCKSKTETCDKVSGHCLSGCLPGWIGSDCQQSSEIQLAYGKPSSNTKKDPTFTALLYVGIVVTAAAVLLCTVGIVMMFRNTFCNTLSGEAERPVEFMVNEEDTNALSHLAKNNSSDSSSIKSEHSTSTVNAEDQVIKTSNSLQLLTISTTASALSNVYRDP